MSMIQLFLSFGIAAAIAAAEEPAAAVLASVEGLVTVTPSGGNSARAGVFDWLKPGTTLETAVSARAIVVLANGDRYQISEHSRAVLGSAAISKLSGELRQLPGLAGLPKLAAIAGTSAGSRGAVVRIRGPQLRHCYPSPNSVILERDAALTFEPSDDVTAYTAEVEDDSGTVIFSAQTAGRTVVLPPGLLRAGAAYYWEVRGISSVGTPPKCQADFSVLPADETSRRTLFKAAVDRLGDDASLALFAEIDRRLGLLKEAKITFQSIQDRSTSSAAIRHALQQIEALIP